MISFQRSKCIVSNDPYAVIRVVAIFDDPFAGLKGHDYINARNLRKPVERVQTSAQQSPLQPEGK